MRELKYSIDNNGHGLIEMPCGTGKTITILSFLIAYKRKRPDIINKIGQGFSLIVVHVGIAYSIGPNRKDWYFYSIAI